MELQIWIRNGEVVALGWTLLHFCWQAVAIAVVYVLADRVAGRAASKMRYALAMGALTLMLCAAVLTFLEQEHLVVRVPQGDGQVITSQVGSLHDTLVHQMPSAAPLVETGELWIAGNADRLLPWIDGIWLVGVLLLMLRALGGWIELQRLRRYAHSAVPEELESSFQRVASRVCAKRKVGLRLSEEVLTPFVMGVWRATVILPVSVVMRLDPAQLEAVLAHELAHVRRWDYLLNLVQTVVECLFFFHPAVWWMSRRARELRETCCDEIAARSCGDPLVYAEALLQMEEQRAQRLQLAAALHGGGGSLLGRVKQILGEGNAVERGTISGMRIGAAGVAVLAFLLGPKVADALKPQVKEIKVASVVREEVKMSAGNQMAQSLIVQANDKPFAPVAEKPTGDKVSVAANSMARPLPAAGPAPTPSPAPLATPISGVEPINPVAGEAVAQGGIEYIQKMRDAGYPLDLDKDLNALISLRSVGVTPEYAKAMAQVGMGTPTLHDLVSLKSIGVTPEYVAGLKDSGIAPASFHEVISEKSLGVTPEYAKSIASVGLGNPTVHDLIGLKSQGVTPEYVAGLKSSGIVAKDLRELISVKAVGVTPEYAKAMGTVGLTNLSTRDLVSLRAQGITPEYVSWLKQAFPSADMSGIRKAAVFHIDEGFVAKAKSHGFNNTDLDKLVKLKMTGLLD
ncbi:M56 family metallopeptidase [Edaphobacter albus]|uniref:M56 family metallopeptidase n=1 Tax=Edaphobacter sp. 4G125 TaxID=2763071 RepID=UPI001647DA3D|nr:M56 family metallopeptidase [Edaphobacter sp. 4G125]QNI35230.1 M48 family metalloprotease [Edaphobacter sp. 4G125]